jgi:hypothetical protein
MELIPCAPLGPGVVSPSSVSPVYPGVIALVATPSNPWRPGVVSESSVIAPPRAASFRLRRSAAAASSAACAFAGRPCTAARTFPTFPAISASTSRRNASSETCTAM